MTSLVAWRELWKALGAARTDEVLRAELLKRYREPHRHYHSEQHLDECLRHLAGARVVADHPAEVELALWFHDAVYDPKRPDNEARSAAWAVEAVTAAGLAPEVAERVRKLVMVTRHDDAHAPATADERLVVDVDLAILGAPLGRFEEYERQVRAEYSGVPGVLFRPRRRAILEAFLARERIYRTPHFHDRFEAKARENLQRSVARLGA
jgi:predicted metal-dependent HD superfamily phosphohydrolase